MQAPRYEALRNQEGNDMRALDEQKINPGNDTPPIPALDERVLAEKVAMTNEELNNAIDTAARYSTLGYGRQECGQMMLKHLRQLLAIQYERARVVRLNVANVGADETAPNAKVSGAGTAPAGLPGYAAGGNGERE